MGGSMPDMIANYNQEKCRNVAGRMLPPVSVLTAMFVLAIWAAPFAIANRPSKKMALVILLCVVAFAVVRAGPFMTNLLVACIRSSKYIWSSGRFIYVGRPFCRRIRLDDVVRVETSHAAGDILELDICLILHGGNRIKFSADISDLPANSLSERISLLVQERKAGAN
jgi:hypothetical protein